MGIEGIQEFKPQSGDDEVQDKPAETRQDAVARKAAQQSQLDAQREEHKRRRLGGNARPE